MVGVTSLGLTTFTVHADTKKAGDTIVSYTAQVQPKQWGISVPANVDLGKNESYPNCLQANATLSIVTDTGALFTDVKIHTFNVSGNFTTPVVDDQFCFVNNEDKQQVKGQLRLFNQGDTVKDWGTAGGTYTTTEGLKSIVIKSYDDKHVAPSRVVQFEGDKDKLEAANKNNAGLSARISWTAKELD